MNNSGDNMDEDKIKSIINCENCIKKSCIIGCPLDNDIPKIIEKVKDKEYEKAYKLFLKTTFLMPICGRICPHSRQCEGSCIKKNTFSKVEIGNIETFIGDLGLSNKWEIKVKKDTNYNVAVIGGGPAGLTCAYFLRKNGINVTIYEKHDYLGGLLIHGIPEFRLPKEIVKNVTDQIENMGIKVFYNKELGKDVSINYLKKKYDAIFIGIGANKSNKMHIAGERLKGVFGGNEYLENKKDINLKNKIVVVSGGGNVAMDVARTIKRKDAKEVYVIYRRSEKNMSADIKEIEEAKKDGIKFIFNTNITKINGQKYVSGVSLIKTEVVQNKKGKMVPQNIEGTDYKLKCDYVFVSVGSHSDNVVRKLRLDLNLKGNIEIGKNGETSTKKVFAGGDVANVKSTVAWAARSGRNAAYAIIDYLEKKNIVN